MSLETELVEAEEAFWDASGNAEFWRENFDDNGLVALSMGLMDKDTVIQTQENAEPWESSRSTTSGFSVSATTSLRSRIGCRPGVPGPLSIRLW